MAISERDLRALVRDAVARHLGPQASAAIPGAVAPGAAGAAVLAHASHAILVLPSSPTDACVIEPDLRCDHCGYCKSLGH